MTIPGETEASPTTRTNLRLIGADPPAAASKAPGSPRRRPLSFWIGCVLAVAVLGLCIGLGSSRAQVRALEADNAALSAALAHTRDRLAAHQARLADVRSRVGELRTRIGSLDALLSSEPTLAPAPSRPMPDSPAGAR